jgi:hypothetical protein
MQPHSVGPLDDQPLYQAWRPTPGLETDACSGPTRAPLSGKRDFKTRDEGTEAASLVQFLLCRDRTLARDARQLGLTGEFPENLVRMGMCGGLGRTRTSDQSVMNWRQTIGIQPHLIAYQVRTIQVIGPLTQRAIGVQHKNWSPRFTDVRLDRHPAAEERCRRGKVLYVMETHGALGTGRHRPASPANGMICDHFD